MKTKGNPKASAINRWVSIPATAGDNSRYLKSLRIQLFKVMWDVSDYYRPISHVSAVADISSMFTVLCQGLRHWYLSTDQTGGRTLVKKREFGGRSLWSDLLEE